MPNTTISAEQLLRTAGALAEVDGRPTYELADKKNDLKIMLKCCKAEERNYWQQPPGERLCAAPFYFQRAAILFRKQKDFEAEIAVCLRWVEMAEDYKEQPMVASGNAAQVHLRIPDFLMRIEKAEALIAKA
jgi:hypothetical protein